MIHLSLADRVALWVGAISAVCSLIVALLIGIYVIMRVEEHVRYSERWINHLGAYHEGTPVQEETRQRQQEGAARAEGDDRRSDQ